MTPKPSRVSLRLDFVRLIVASVTSVLASITSVVASVAMASVVASVASVTSGSVVNGSVICLRQDLDCAILLHIDLSLLHVENCALDCGKCRVKNGLEVHATTCITHPRAVW